MTYQNAGAQQTWFPDPPEHHSNHKASSRKMSASEDGENIIAVELISDQQKCTDYRGVLIAVELTSDWQN